MENPAKLLRRAQQNRRAPAIRPAAAREEVQTPPSPPHQSSHASYSALMRSHDRVHTRHIGGQGGANRA